MTVTQIVEHTKSRSKVYIDQEFAFVLYKGELRRYHISEGNEIDMKDYLSLMHDILPRRAKLRCMNLLKSRDYTRHQLKEKLKQGLYPEEVMEEALDYAASFRYIDDDRYALDYIRCSSDKKSRRRIEADLAQKGLDRDTVCRAWKRWTDEGNVQDEERQIARLLEKRHFRADQADRKQLQSTYAFLARKGFSAESIRKAMKNDWDEEFCLT